MERQTTLLPEIAMFAGKLDFNSIPTERKAILQPMIDFIQTKVSDREEARINFICTHNSRRSHFGQVWSQTAAAYYKIEKISCYSGGTDATALYPLVAETLEHLGFTVQTIAEGNNPVYAIKFAENEHPVIGFSKRYDDEFNPNAEFVAIMTCSQADGGCPFIAGAEKRIAITFDDPKMFDGTPQQKEKYLERSIQIGTEMFYVFSKIKNQYVGE